jgi:hypothetical protein
MTDQAHAELVDAVDVVPDAEPQRAATDLVLRPTREALTPIDPDAVIAGMQAYQDLLPRLLEPSDFQNAGDGKRFVKKSGWRKIARAFNLSLLIIERTVERDDEGHAVRAEVVARAIAPNGQSQDGDGYCSIDEERFRDIRGRQRIEQDLRATATTRAKNRAIADLVGMGDVDDEVDGSGDHRTLPGYYASPELRTASDDALSYLLDGDVALIQRTNHRLTEQFDGKLATGAAQAIVICAQSVKRLREQEAAA